MTRTSVAKRVPEERGGGGVDRPVTRLLSLQETAERLSLSRDWVGRLVMRGDIFSVKAGKRRLVPETAIDDYVARLVEQTR